jgi:hypothetical protein
MQLCIAPGGEDYKFLVILTTRNREPTSIDQRKPIANQNLQQLRFDQWQRRGVCTEKSPTITFLVSD